jgi:type II secretory pathway component PulC
MNTTYDPADPDIEAIVKASPFEIQEEEHKHRIIIKGQAKELSQLISLYTNHAGTKQEQFITGESLNGWGHAYQKVYFWGDHVIIEVQGPTSETKEIRYFKDIKPLTYSHVDAYNKLYSK